MESPAENKRAAALALAVLGLLMAGALVVLTVFGDDDGEPDTGTVGRPPVSAAPTGAADGKGGSGGPAADGPAPILSPAEVGAAHRTMTAYMAGLSTYAHTDEPASWTGPLLALTTGDPELKRDTALPTGKAWASCVAARCSSKGEAVVVRDALIADDLVRDSGRTVSTLVKVTATRAEDGRAAGTESNSWLVTAHDGGGGTWKVSGVSLFGLGNVGASDQAGG